LIALGEDPTLLLTAIVGAARSNAKPDRKVETAKRLDELFEGKPLKRALMTPLMRMAKARVRDRENLRFERTRIFGHARRVFLAIGTQYFAQGIISDPRDVFYLTVDEVLGGIEGYGTTLNLAGLVAIRKSEMAEAATKPDPGERITFIGAVSSRNMALAAPPEPTDNNDQTRIATGCCAGKVTAKARVVRDPRTEGLEPGEILVARHTDPGWIAVFSNAAAIVVERGSLLSHSAIVAREMGIPCVVGMKGAMEWIRSGEVIEVDGGLGRVSKTNG
jgi:phosphohistidine swiveling domain-containing protein